MFQTTSSGFIKQRNAPSSAADGYIRIEERGVVRPLNCRRDLCEQFCQPLKLLRMPKTQQFKLLCNRLDDGSSLFGLYRFNLLMDLLEPLECQRALLWRNRALFILGEQNLCNQAELPTV
ncbi:MAG: hypothetical protein ACR2KU_01790 [Gammaproteobacteria bacterium]